MNKLAICIPTYNRSDILQEIMMKSFALYQKYGIDVYIFDSSEDAETERVVEKYKDIYTNLSYIRIDSSVHSNMKVYKIYQHFQQNALYEYIWICSDSIVWSERVVKDVCQNLDKEYDLIIVNPRDVENLGTRIYNDKNVFFLDCAWHMTQYGVSIVKLGTLLKNIDWEYMIERYIIPERINHSHVALYFEQLSMLDSFKALHLSVKPNDWSGSLLKTKPNWQQHTFFIWCKCWSSMIEALPDCYHNKDEVMKKHGTNSRILGLDSLVELRDANIYSLKVYKQYKLEIEKTSDVNPVLLFVIALMPRRFCIFLSKKVKYRRKIKKKLNRFCAGFKNIYIYGRGRKGVHFAEYLEEMGVSYKGFLVSALPEDEKRIFREHSVQEYSAVFLEDKSTAILLALNQENTAEVLIDSPELVNSKQVFVDRWQK